MKKPIKYGIVGFSRNQFDKQAAHKILAELFRNIKTKHPERQIEIVSGYTNSGVPKLAYELACKFGFVTVGFSARQALKVRAGVFPVDKVMLQGEKFGDESEDFVRYIDGLIRVGGGRQSRRECEMFKLLHAGDLLKFRIKEFEVAWYGEKPEPEIKGVTLVENFLTPEHQAELLMLIDSGTWLTELKRRVQHFGYKYDYKARSISREMKADDLPFWIEPVVQKLLDQKLLDYRPDQLIINEYEPGQGIAAHVDCVPCFGDQIVSVSLGSAVVMDFSKLKTNEKFSVILNQGSALVMQGEARYNWKHGIAARKSDMMNGKRIQRSRRVSLTFRKVILDGE